MLCARVVVFVSKTVVLKGTEGSNPSLSAKKTVISYQRSAISLKTNKKADKVES